MKNYLFLATSVVFAMLSCQKEVQIEEHEVPDGLVKMTFQAYMEADDATRAVLASNGRSTEWKAGDEIAVFDNVNNTIHKFIAESDGATTSFTGMVNADATSFVAVYPYTDDTAYNPESDTPISANIPVIQEAVKDSYDPKAALLVAAATQDPLGEDKEINQKFTFTPAFALFKVNVDVDDISAVYVENTKIAMSGSVVAKTTGSLSNGTGSTYKWISLQKEDGTAIEKGTYYIVSRFAGTNSLENFKMTYVKSDASSLTRTASSSITSEIFKRKSILDMGGLSDFPESPSVSWYSFYQAGLDIQIGSKTINRLTEGDATLINNESISDAYDFRSAVNTKTGVFFFRTAGGAFTNSSTISITQNLFLLNDSNTKVLFTNQNKSWNFMNGSLYLKGLSYDVSGRTGGALFTNTSGVTAVSDVFIMEDCVFYGMTKNLYAPNSGYLGYIVRRLEAVGCSFGYNLPTTNIELINLSAATQPTDFEHFVFNNNLVYNSTGTNTTRVTILSMHAYVDATYTLDAQINRNLMVNAVGASNGSWAFTDVASLEITDNVYYDGNSYGSNCNLFDIKNTSTSVSSLTLSDNVVIGLADDKKWTYTNGTISALTNVKAALPDGTNQITKRDASSVFSVSPSFSDGVVSYTLLAPFENVGPQNLPADI